MNDEIFLENNKLKVLLKVLKALLTDYVLFFITIFLKKFKAITFLHMKRESLQI